MHGTLLNHARPHKHSIHAVLVRYRLKSVQYVTGIEFCLLPGIFIYSRRGSSPPPPSPSNVYTEFESAQCIGFEILSFIFVLQDSAASHATSKYDCQQFVHPLLKLRDRPKPKIVRVDMQVLGQTKKRSACVYT